MELEGLRGYSSAHGVLCSSSHGPCSGPWPVGSRWLRRSDQPRDIKLHPHLPLCRITLNFKQDWMINFYWKIFHFWRVSFLVPWLSLMTLSFLMLLVDVNLTENRCCLEKNYYFFFFRTTSFDNLFILSSLSVTTIYVFTAFTIYK